MSTTPGRNTWTDAGPVPPDSAEIPTPDRGSMPVDPARQPAAARPDPLSEAAEQDRAEEERGPADDEALPSELPPDTPEADALEQHLAASGLPPEPLHLRDDAAEHDLIEQAQDVPGDDEEYPIS